MSAALTAVCAASAAVGAIAGAYVPRAAYRLSVEFGSPHRRACTHCAEPFPAGLAGWAHPAIAARAAGGGWGRRSG